ncbi:MAG: ABC transporter permease [Chitinivibrionia bacterium]|nr:ABC transporter permease [Chitinivibrionia bacterium]
MRKTFGILLLLLAIAPSALPAAVGCDLNDPDRDVKRLFPQSTGYKTLYVSIAKKGGEKLLEDVERRLGDAFQGLYETIDVPYTMYQIFKGREIIGYIHGVNQKGRYGGIQVFLALDTLGVIKTFYIQKLTSKGAKSFREDSFGSQFAGLSLADFYRYDPASGKETPRGKITAIKNPASGAADDFTAMLRATKKNLILVDEFLLNNRHLSGFRPVDIAYKNLLRKKMRSVLTVLGIALAAWVLTSLLGFNRGYQISLNKDIDNLGFQMLVTAKGCPYEAATLMLKGGTGLRYLNAGIADSIAAQPEVDSVTPMLMQAVFDPNKGESGGISAYLGVDPATFPRMKGTLAFKAGGWFTDPGAREAVLGYEAAELEQREVGDMLLIPEKDAEVKVAGILARTGTQDDGTIFLPLSAVQEIFGKEGELTGIGIKVHKEADIAAFEERMYRLPDVQVVSLSQVKNTIMMLVSTAKVMVLSIAIIAVLISVVGVVNTILMSVMERRQEIGILKAMGAKARDIFKLIWLETVILCVGGGIVGSALAVLTAKLTEIFIRGVLPFSPSGGFVTIDWTLALFTLGVVTAIGILSGIYPSWKAGSVRPLETMRSEAE